MGRILQIALLSFVGAFGCAVLFVTALSWGLPPTDAAYHQSPLRILWDPFMLGGIVCVATPSALATTVVASFWLRGRRIVPCATFIFTMVAIEILLTAPTGTPIGIPGAYIALVLSLLYCRSSSHRWFVV